MSNKTPSITIDDVLLTNSALDLYNLIQSAAEESGYFNGLPFDFDYWHYGRHAEHAAATGRPDLQKLFSVAWQMQNRVHDNPANEANLARAEIRAKYTESGEKSKLLTTNVERFVSEGRQQELIELAASGYPAAAIRMAIKESIEAALVTGTPALAANVDGSASSPAM